MVTIRLALFAFIFAAVFSTLELVTTKFPRTSFLLFRRPALYLYGFSYGAFAFVVMLILDKLIADKSITLSGPLISAPWTRALAIGLTIKALLHLNLFSITAGTKITPIGLETIIQLFEPELLRTMTYDEFLELRSYLSSRVNKYPDLTTVKKQMIENIPPSLPDDERTTFENALDKDATIIKAMDRFFRFVGRSAFERIFPN